MTRPDIVCRKCSQPAVGFHVLALPYDPNDKNRRGWMSTSTTLVPTCDDHARRPDYQVLPIDTWWRTYVVESVLES